MANYPDGKKSTSGTRTSISARTSTVTEVPDNHSSLQVLIRNAGIQGRPKKHLEKLIEHSNVCDSERWHAAAARTVCVETFPAQNGIRRQLFYMICQRASCRNTARNTFAVPWVFLVWLSAGSHTTTLNLHGHKICIACAQFSFICITYFITETAQCIFVEGIPIIFDIPGLKHRLILIWKQMNGMLVVVQKTQLLE